MPSACMYAKYNTVSENKMCVRTCPNRSLLSYQNFNGCVVCRFPHTMFSMPAVRNNISFPAPTPLTKAYTNLISDFGKLFSDIGKSFWITDIDNHFPISENNWFSDIVKSKWFSIWSIIWSFHRWEKNVLRRPVCSGWNGCGSAWGYFDWIPLRLGKTVKKYP